jgi:hypothetical protein
MRAPLLGVFGALTALAGLSLAAGSRDPAMLLDGMLFMLFGVGLNFWLIARATRH